MSEEPNFRAWAARLASKAGKEPDLHESQRLMSIVEYWNWLADLDDWERDGFRPASEAKSH
jgi:hypothetical protein